MWGNSSQVQCLQLQRVMSLKCGGESYSVKTIAVLLHSTFECNSQGFGGSLCLGYHAVNLFFFFLFLFFCQGRYKNAYFPPASFQIVSHKEAAKFPKLLVL